MLVDTLADRLGFIEVDTLDDTRCCLTHVLPGYQEWKSRHLLTHLPSLRLRWSSTHWLTGQAVKVDTLKETSHEYEAKAQDDTLHESIPVVEIATPVDSVAKVEDVALITQWSTSQTVEINVLDEGRGPNVHTLASRDRVRDTLLTRFAR